MYATLDSYDILMECILLHDSICAQDLKNGENVQLATNLAVC